jgi:prolyl 4-hydroxylase
MDLEPEKFTSNPLSAFTLIRTLTSDTLLIGNKLQSTIDGYTESVDKYTPQYQDLMAAADGLTHLQETYNLKTSDLAQGIVDGKKFCDGLNAYELYEIGQQLLLSNRFSRSIEYLRRALKKSVIDQDSETKPTEILLAIFEASIKSGDIKTATRTIDEIIYLEPGNKRMLLIKENLMKKRAPDELKFEKEHTDDFETALTRSVCSGKLTKSPKELSKLHCRLVIRNGFSRLAPFKLEEANLVPYIVVFHDVIFEKEIQKLRSMAGPTLYQSETNNPDGKVVLKTEIRISKVTWFRDYEDVVVERISKRTEEMTGLTRKTAEPLQIQQYGIGGFYKCHYDVRPLLPGEFMENGERIATTLFYVNRSFVVVLAKFLIHLTAFRCRERWINSFSIPQIENSS